MPDIMHGTGTTPDAPASGELLQREKAIKQLERKRRFWISIAWSATAMVILVVIWAISEYHNAGGWPARGFSQSSGIHDVWNFWIIYPLGAWLLAVAAHAWAVYGSKPISENEIQREIDRHAGPRV